MERKTSTSRTQDEIIRENRNILIKGRQMKRKERKQSRKKLRIRPKNRRRDEKEVEEKRKRRVQGLIRKENV